MPAGRRRGVTRKKIVVSTPPITDDFTGVLNTSTKWTGTTYGVSNVGGRLQIPVDGTFPQAQTGAVFNLNTYPVWIEFPTNPVIGNGSKYTRFHLTNGSSYASFYFEGTPGAVALQLTGQSSTFVTYNATNHRWLRFQVSGGNLLWQTSADKSTWTTQRTFAAPSWITSGLVSAVLDAAATGTESASVAEYDNFNL